MSDISVTIVAATNASVSILNDDTVNVSAGPGFVGGGATALLVEAGANITVTTTNGAFVISGQSIPVQSVNGKTGVVSLTASDLGGLTAVANVTKVNGRTGDVTLVYTDVSAAGMSHGHIAADIFDLKNVANVVSVNGITGAPTLVAGANVTISTSGSSITISAGGGGGTSGGSVLSVNGRSGVVVLSSTDVSAASSSHTHAASDITNLTSVANVVSVNGRTGAVALTRADLTAAAAAHTHAASDITNLTSVANVVSVNGKTGTVSLVAADLTAAASSHGHNYVTSLNGNTGTISVVAGSNVTVTTAAGSIVIAGPTVTQGERGTFGDPQVISQKTASYVLQTGDVGSLLTLHATAGTVLLTIPSTSAAAWVAGSHIDLARTGTAAVQVTGDGGVSLLATPGATLRDIGSGASLVFLGSDKWLLVGDLA